MLLFRFRFCSMRLEVWIGDAATEAELEAAAAAADVVEAAREVQEEVCFFLGLRPKLEDITD